ncbi:MAG: sulfatase [Cyclobacteriaceae bacterium]|nr:sulfatase [Cyclobacteriaceae bacterium]
MLLWWPVMVTAQNKPNVLFIISDDLTTTALSQYENKICQTPHFDRLAAEGTLFMRAYCQFPICGPSRASMLSGYYPHAAESFQQTSGRENVGSDKKMLPQWFKENGYHTARVSKIFHMRVPGDIEEGTDGTDDPDCWVEKYNSQGPEWQAPGEGELVQKNPDGTLPIRGGNVMTIVKADGDDLVHSDGKTAEKTIELIKKHKDKPFFIAAGFVRPHVPFVAPRKYFEPYPHEHMVLPPKVEGDWEDIPPAGINYITSLNSEMSEQQQKKAIAGYYAAVSYMDAQLGKILKALRDEGLEDNTIIVFTSDHGFHLGEHDFWMKVSLHEESVRVPLVIKVPGQKPSVNYAFAELIDLYPTLTELAGLPLPQEVQGKSLVPIIKDQHASVRDHIFSVSVFRDVKSFLLRDHNWAYIQYNEDASEGIELYNMQYDPGQYNNLAGNPLFTGVVEHYKKHLRYRLSEVRNNDIVKLEE